MSNLRFGCIYFFVPLLPPFAFQPLCAGAGDGVKKEERASYEVEFSS
jgi:hypothetical protein